MEQHVTTPLLVTCLYLVKPAFDVFPFLNCTPSKLHVAQVVYHQTS